MFCRKHEKEKDFFFVATTLEIKRKLIACDCQFAAKSCLVIWSFLSFTCRSTIVCIASTDGCSPNRTQNRQTLLSESDPFGFSNIQHHTQPDAGSFRMQVLPVSACRPTQKANEKRQKGKKRCVFCFHVIERRTMTVTTSKHAFRTNRCCSTPKREANERARVREANVKRTLRKQKQKQPVTKRANGRNLMILAKNDSKKERSG